MPGRYGREDLVFDSKEDDTYDYLDNFTERFVNFVKEKADLFNRSVDLRIEDTVDDMVKKGERRWKGKKNEKARELIKDAIKEEWIKKAKASLGKNLKPKREVTDQEVLDNLDVITKTAKEADREDIRNYLKTKLSAVKPAKPVQSTLEPKLDSSKPELNNDDDIISLEEIERDLDNLGLSDNDVGADAGVAIEPSIAKGTDKDLGSADTSPELREASESEASSKEELKVLATIKNYIKDNKKNELVKMFTDKKDVLDELISESSKKINKGEQPLLSIFEVAYLKGVQKVINKK